MSMPFGTIRGPIKTHCLRGHERPVERVGKACKVCLQIRTKNDLQQHHRLISLGEYNRRFQIQGGCCKICSRHQSILNKRLSVDHDHQTGKIRGLLCNSCNLAIGNFKESLNLIKQAVIYLESEEQPCL